MAPASLAKDDCAALLQLEGLVAADVWAVSVAALKTLAQLPKDAHVDARLHDDGAPLLVGCLIAD